MNLNEIINFYYDNLTWQERCNLKTVLTSWGNKCFNAAREIECTTVGEIDDIPGVVHSNKYKDFENYLESLDNGTD